MPKFGAHMTTAGGLPTAIAEAVRFRCDCLQLFVKNQRQWRAPPLSDEQIAAWAAARRPAGLAPAVVHASYLLNLASPDDALWRRSRDALLDELDRSEALGIEFVVVHPGAHLDSGESAGLGRIAAAIDWLAAERPKRKCRLLLETTAGQGTTLGWRFEQLAEVFARAGRPGPVGVCLDTCHLFAAGYDLGTSAAVGRTLDQFDRVIGLDRLFVIHLNDSKRELGSRVDRHEHVGRGRIGARGLGAVVREPRLADLPMILETPKGVDPASGREWDAINLAKLRRMAKR